MDEYDDMVKLDGFDGCVVGAVERVGLEGRILCYDQRKVLAELQRAHGMSLADAQEWFEYNIAQAWHGERTPCFLDTGFGVDCI